MNKYRDQLEGTSQLLRIRRLRRIVYAFLFVLAVVLSGASMAVEGASLKPAFFPINGVATIVVLLAFFGVLAGIAFRTLEIRYAKRDSQRFLIIKASIRRAWGVMVLAAILGVVLLLPFAARAIDNTLHEVRSQPIGPRTSASFSFVGTDALGLTRFVSGAFDVRGIAVWSATLYMNSSYPTITAGWSALHKDLVPLKQPAYVEYTIVVQNADTVPIQATLTLDHELAPEFTLIVPVMFLAFAIVEGLWIAYARPLHAKYQGSSIYSVRYEQAADSGERTFAEYFQGPRAPARGGPTSTPVAVRPEPTPMVPALARAPLRIPPPPPPIEIPVPEPGAPGGAPERRSTDLLEEGSKLFSEGQFEPALALFDEVLEREPSNGQALLAGAAVLLRLNRRDEALRQYEQVLGLDPRNAKALAGRARIFEADGRWAQAAQAWGAYLEVVPPDLEARMSHAEAILNTGDRAGAVRALEQALFLAPSDFRIRKRIESLTINVPQILSRALVASASGRYDEALVDFGLILAVDPDNVNALVGRGVALRRSGNLEEALHAFDLALAKQPGNSAALRAKGTILEDTRDYKGALDVYDDLLAWNPRDAEVWALQGATLEKLNEPEEALASYMEALKLEPGNGEWRRRADALESSRKGQEAFLEELFSIEGVGPVRARALLAAGYKTSDTLRNATEDEIANVNGMTRKLAQDIYRHFHPAAPPPPPDTPAPAG